MEGTALKEITLFYLEDCPYCHYAKRALKELKQEKPEYDNIRVEWIEESRQPELVAQYDYYYVPTIFYGKKKLYEAHPSEDYAACKENVKAALDTVCRME